MRNLVEEHCHCSHKAHFVIYHVAYADAEPICKIVDKVANHTYNSKLFEAKLLLVLFLCFVVLSLV